MTHDFDEPTVDSAGGRVVTCSCGLVLRAPAMAELVGAMADHVQREER